MLILAGLTLNCAVFGALFRPVEESYNYNKPLLLRIKEARDTMWTDSDEEESPTGSQNSAPPPYCEVMKATNYAANNNEQETKELIRYQMTDDDDQKRKMRKRAASLPQQPIYREQIFFSALSLVSLKQKMKINPACSTKSIDKKSVRFGSSASVESLSCEEAPSESSSRFSSLLAMFDLTLLTSPSFLLLAISGFLTLSGFFIPFMYIVKRATTLEG